MGTPYVGEIRICPYNFAPSGWMSCDGQLLSIAEYEVLFQLIGTTYGGDGQTTYALPDLRGRIPLHQGTGPGGNTYVIGQNGGTETVTITPAQMPAHSHAAVAVGAAGNVDSPAATAWAGSALGAYATAPSANLQPLAPNALAPAGGSQPHDNRMPYLGVHYIISLFGVFPSQT